MPDTPADSRTSRRRRQNGGSGTRRAWRLPSPRELWRTAIGGGTAVALWLLLSVHFLPDQVSLRPGERSPMEIRAARTVGYVDTDATRLRRDDVARHVPNSYDFDPGALAQASRYASDLFDTVQRVRDQPGPLTSPRKYDRLARELGGVLSPDQIRYALTTPRSTLEGLRSSTTRLVEAAEERGIRSDGDDVQRARSAFRADAAQEFGGATDASIVQTVGAHALRADQILNVRRTFGQREAEMRRVKPVSGVVHAGEVLVRPGDIFTQTDLDKAKALGLITPRLDVVTALAVLGLAAAMVLVVSHYARSFCPSVYDSPKLLMLLAGIVVTSAFGLKLFGQVLGIPLSMVQFGFAGMMMVTAAGMLIATMLDVQLAILVCALLSVFSGLLMNHELRFSVMTLISSIVGILCAAGFRDRRDLLRAACVVGLTNLALVWVLGGLLGDTLHEMAYGSVWAMLSAGIGVGLFWFGMVGLEKPFGILTHAWLLELSASEHPLLRELCFKAPGTYAHSIMVGNLAEAGAEAIGANALLCRVASYYHDVGKLRQPHCYVENQHGDNIHSRLKPSLSALIIVSHVRDGLELADQYRLPAQIRAVIAEHHGTSLIQYFYHQALGPEGTPDPVLEQRFRYEGPRPQTRESGIIMLADTVEAAVRCLDRPTAARIQSRVEELIHQKLVDGQLDESDLTFRDIGRLQSAFTRILTAMHHGRVEYPEAPALAEKAPQLAAMAATELRLGIGNPHPEGGVFNKEAAIDLAAGDLQSDGETVIDLDARCYSEFAVDSDPPETAAGRRAKHTAR